MNAEVIEELKELSATLAKDPTDAEVKAVGTEIRMINIRNR